MVAVHGGGAWRWRCGDILEPGAIMKQAYQYLGDRRV